MGSPTRGNNPFVVDTDYNPEAYNPFVVEDNNQDDVVPAIVPAVQPVQQAQPASRPAPPPAATTLQFTDSGLSNAPVLGRIQQPGSAPPPSRPEPPAPVNQIQSAPSPLPDDPFDSTKYPFYNVRRYRKYFNVDTKDVLWRLSNSVLGPFKADFLETTWDSPDLYGPFWVATTLVFVTAVAGNYNSYLQYQHDVKKHGAADADGLAGKQWYNDASKMSYSALMFYGYIFCLGLALYFALRWFKADIKLSNVWCIYGYSLSVFIPVSFLCIVPINWFKWSLVGAATLSSGLFLLLNFQATIYSAAPARALMLLGIMLACHLALGLAMKLYFFHYSIPAATAASPAPPGRNLYL